MQVATGSAQASITGERADHYQIPRSLDLMPARLRLLLVVITEASGQPAAPWPDGVGAEANLPISR